MEQRLHPLTILYRALRAAPQYLPIVLIIAYQRSQELSWFLLLETVIVLLFTIPYFLVWYLTFTYRITDEGILIRWGILKRQERMVPYERIQNVHIHRDILHRLLGLARIEIETAGAQTTEIALNAVAFREAAQLQQQLLKARRLSQSPPSISTASHPPVYEVSLSKIALLGLVRLNPLVFVLLAVALPFIPDSIFNEVTQQLHLVLNHFFQSPRLSAILFIFGVLILVLLINQFLSAIFALLFFGNFKLTVHPHQLTIRYGLLTHRHDTIPIKKIQHLTISTNPLFRILGLASLNCVTAGSQQQRGGFQPILPIAEYRTITAFIEAHLGLTIPSAFMAIHPLYWIRFSIRYGIGMVILFSLLPMSTSALPFFFIVLGSLIVYRYLHYRHFGYHLHSDAITIRSGIFYQRIRIIPIRKLQSWGIQAGLWQRRWNLGSLWIETAAGSGSVTTIADLPTTLLKSCIAFIRRWYHSV